MPGRQLPITQLVGGSSVQRLLQAPQLFLSVLRSTQPPVAGHLVWPAGQSPAQVPAMQRPEAHTFRQAPQFIGSLRRFTQVVPHIVWLGGQGATQAPARQT